MCIDPYTTHTIRGGFERIINKTMNKLTYEDCKELKDAGFPQGIDIGDKFYSLIGHPRMGIPIQQAENTSFIKHTKEMNNLSQCVKIPTLSELIEACGKPNRKGNPYFRSIHQLTQKKWIAYGWLKDNEDKIFAQGTTPEEAVANLWLELNKK